MEGSEQHSLPELKIHDQRLGFQSNPDSNRDLPPPDDSIKLIVAQLHTLSMKEVVNGEAHSSSPIHAIDDEEIKLKQAFDEELYHLTVKQAISEALQDEHLKQAIDREIAASEALGDGLHDHALRRFIDEALESNLKKVDTETYAEDEEVKAEGGNEAKGSPEMITVMENVSSDGVDETVGDEGIKNYEGDDSENGNEGTDGADAVEDEVQIHKDHNYVSNRAEYENRESSGWDEDKEEYGVNTHEDYRSENGKEEGYTVNDNGGEDSGTVLEPKDERQRNYHYPLRPDAEDCSYYIKTGMCKYGSNCKFNHPLRRKNQGLQVTKETVGQREESSERPGQIECKYYLTSTGCKYGNACKYKHSKGKPPIAPIVEFNFLGLPIRPGEKECPYYMRTGSCKYGSNCRFNHPDPTAAVGGNTPSRYNNNNGGSVSLQGAPKTMPSWSSPRARNETPPFVPVMYPPTQPLPPPNHDWNGYQAPIYPPSETGLPTPPAFAMNSPATDTPNFYPHHQLPIMVEDYPERPGEPECSYFLKTGDCKYRSNCRFHHPKNRVLKAPPCNLSDKGLPLRPGQNTCAHYSRYGICKFGPACKYDHPPVNHNNNSTWSEPDEPSSFGNSATANGDSDWK